MNSALLDSDSGFTYPCVLKSNGFKSQHSRRSRAFQRDILDGRRNSSHNAILATTNKNYSVSSLFFQVSRHLVVLIMIVASTHKPSRHQMQVKNFKVAGQSDWLIKAPSLDRGVGGKGNEYELASSTLEADDKEIRHSE